MVCSLFLGFGFGGIVVITIFFIVVRQPQVNSYQYVYRIPWSKFDDIVNIGLILGLHPANERRRYKLMPFLIGWAQT